MAKLPYSQKTKDLINRMCRYVERKDFELNKKKAEECLLKTYDLFGLKRPTKLIWCIDIFDEKFEVSARSARSAWSAGFAGSAGSAGSARSAGWTALDEEFYYFVFTYEYCENPNKEHSPNENDRKYLEYSELLLQALEYGLGYRVEWEDTLYLVPTPLVLIDERNRFHSTEKPAIRWKNGHEFYYIHGVNVDEKIVKYPEKLTKKDWINQTNLEVRRIIQDRMPNFVEKIGAKSINYAKGYELFEIDVNPDPEKIAHYLKMKDTSTDRIYYLRVPPNINNAPDALAWSFNLSVEEYKPIQES